MLKTTIIGGLFVALAGMLVADAFHRTATSGPAAISNQHGQKTQDVAKRGGPNGAGGNRNDLETSDQANVTD